MRASVSSDPVEGLSWAERLRWRTAARRITRNHDAEELAVLKGLAAGRWPVMSVGSFQRELLSVGPVQFLVGRQRVIATRVHPVAWTSLEAAAGAGGLTLTGAGRYGAGWTLTFEGPAGPLVILAERVVLRRSDGGNLADGPAPQPAPASRSRDLGCYPRATKAPEPQVICRGQ